MTSPMPAVTAAGVQPEQKAASPDAPTVLSLNDILSVPNQEEEYIEIPEWKGNVKIRSLSKNEQRTLREFATDSQGNVDGNALEKGIFLTGLISPSVNDHQYTQLCEKASGSIDKVIGAIMKLSHMGEDAVKLAARKFS